MKRLAIVTGANRGLGFETSRELAKKGYELILTARKSAGHQKALELKNEGLDAHFHLLDIQDEVSIKTFYEWVHKEKGRADILVNNGAVLLDRQTGYSIKEKLMESFEINTVGAYLLCELFLPLMEKNSYGRIVNVSSGMGQLSLMSDDDPCYRISKTALNAVTRIFHARKVQSNVLINSICPGWIKTDMGGPNAPGTLKEGTSGIVWAATLPEGGPSGGYFRNENKLEW